MRASTAGRSSANSTLLRPCVVAQPPLTIRLRIIGGIGIDPRHRRGDDEAAAVGEIGEKGQGGGQKCRHAQARAHQQDVAVRAARRAEGLIIDRPVHDGRGGAAIQRAHIHKQSARAGVLAAAGGEAERSQTSLLSVVAPAEGASVPRAMEAAVRATA